MSMEALFTIDKMWKQPKCSSTDECINKMWSIQTMEYYSDIQRNKVLTHVTIWMNLENTMLCERSQTYKAKYCTIPFI